MRHVIMIAGLLVIVASIKWLAPGAVDYLVTTWASQFTIPIAGWFDIELGMDDGRAIVEAIFVAAMIGVGYWAANEQE